MISTADFRNGMVIELDGDLMEIVEFQHVKPGKGRRICSHKVQEFSDRAGIGKDFPIRRKI